MEIIPYQDEHRIFRETYLPDCITGNILMSICITGILTGSDEIMKQIIAKAITQQIHYLGEKKRKHEI
jgi:hypothetical protein